MFTNIQFFRGHRALLFCTCAMCWAAPDAAAVIFYYDNVTGMVAFDTATSPTGRLTSYQLGFIDSDYAFRPENHARISNSTFFLAQEKWVSDRSDARPLEGYYGIGEILQPGISESVWSTMFKRSASDISIVSEGVYYYADISGNDAFTDGYATFVYGLPDRPFENATKLLDLESIRWAETAELKYVPENGEVILDTTGSESGYISGIFLEMFDFDSSLNPESFQPPVPDALLSLTTTGQLGFLTDVISPGRYSLGEIMKPGLDRQQFADEFLSANFSTRARSESGLFDITVSDAPLQVVFVPEPTAALFLVIPVAYCAIRRQSVH